MKKIILGLGLLLFTQAGFCAFSPLTQSIIEIRDIITSPDLKRFFPPNEAILDIRWMRNGYLLSTAHYQLFVEVIYGREARSAGGEEAETKPFKLQFNQPEAK